MKRELEWLKGLKEGARRFLAELSEDDYSYFRYSLSGDLYGSSRRWGLGNLVFAGKILHMTGLLAEIGEIRKGNLIKAIKGFGTGKGMIYDPLITRLGFGGKLAKGLGLMDRRTAEGIEKIRRAETRQAFAALRCLGSGPEHSFPGIPDSKAKVDDYLSALDWRNPWDAGSHFSHLVFFLAMNDELSGGGVLGSRQLIDNAIEWVNRVQSAEEGCWYWQGASLRQKINGAMKVLTGFAVVGYRDFPYKEQLIDMCLGAANDKDACDNFNIAYVLTSIGESTNYRKEDVEKFLLRRLELYEEYYHPEQGGFSFNVGRAGERYYGVEVTRGLDEADIHGTVMFLWGISRITRALKIEGVELLEPVT